MSYHIYDIETYRNIFTFTWRTWKTKEYKTLEISDRKNELTELIDLLSDWSVKGDAMIGFNNVMFDYPVLHHIMFNQCAVQALDIYKKAQSIIDTPWNNRFSNIIWDKDRVVRQIDLFLVNHFDNIARRTSLKDLEFAMRAKNLASLPYDVHSDLDDNQCDKLIVYNVNDVENTYNFFLKCIPALEFRKSLSEMYSTDFTNHNDTKIGKDIFIRTLESHTPGICYTKSRGRKSINQTVRDFVHGKDIIFPYIKFDDAAATETLDKFKSLKISSARGGMKGIFKDFEVKSYGIDLIYGQGGLHGSVNKTFVESQPGCKIIDVDVASFYPNIAIANSLYPAHLNNEFCEIYEDLYNQRRSHPKGTPMNAALKLALNGVYGDSNNEYSPFLDFQYTMSITINGQLLLTMLIDQLHKNIPNLKFIQVNTDGITVLVSDSDIQELNNQCKRWESLTKLTLEQNEYSRMFIRDVNNYIAEYHHSKKVKRKGCYEYILDWHKDQSSLIVQKAVERKLLHNIPIEDTVYADDDAFDFMIKTRVNRGSKLFLNQEKELDKCVRFFISNTDDRLYKWMPPAPKKPDKERWSAIKKGCGITLCNESFKFDFKKLNYKYYIQEAEKLSDFENKMTL